jgi:hypothetical protein
MGHLNKYAKTTGWTDDELLEMTTELSAALAVVEQIPGYNLAIRALCADLDSYMHMAYARDIRKFRYPDKKALLKKLHK